MVSVSVSPLAYCVVPEKIHAHPMEGYWKFLGGGGVLKAKFLEEMYENKLEFPGERGSAKQKPSVGGVWIFSGTAHNTIGQHTPQVPREHTNYSQTTQNWTAFSLGSHEFQVMLI